MCEIRMRILISWGPKIFSELIDSIPSWVLQIFDLLFAKLMFFSNMLNYYSVFMFSVTSVPFSRNSSFSISVSVQEREILWVSWLPPLIPWQWNGFLRSVSNTPQWITLSLSLHPFQGLETIIKCTSQCLSYNDSDFCIPIDLSLDQLPCTVTKEKVSTWLGN